MNATTNLKKNPKEVIKSIASNHLVFTVIKDLPWPLSTRRFIIEQTWKKQPDGSYIYAWRPPTTDQFEDSGIVDIGKNKQKQLIRADSKGFAIIQKIDERSCKLSWLQQGDLKGNIPHQIMNSQIPRSLGAIFQVREKFKRDDEIDKMHRKKMVKLMKNRYQEEVYDKNEELFLIESIQKQMSAVKTSSFRKLPSPDFRTKMSIAHIKGESMSYMKCEVTIDASLEEVAAYNFIYMSRKRVEINDKRSMLFRDATDINKHTQVSERSEPWNNGNGASTASFLVEPSELFEKEERKI